MTHSWLTSHESLIDKNNLKNDSSHFISSRKGGLVPFKRNIPFIIQNSPFKGTNGLFSIINGIFCLNGTFYATSPRISERKQNEHRHRVNATQCTILKDWEILNHLAISGQIVDCVLLVAEAYQHLGGGVERFTVRGQSACGETAWQTR